MSIYTRPLGGDFSADYAGDTVGGHRLANNRNSNVSVTCFFDTAIFTLNEHGAMAAVADAFHGPIRTLYYMHWFPVPHTWHSLVAAAAWYIYMKNPSGLAEQAKEKFGFIYRLLDNKYYFDRFNEVVFATTSRGIGQGMCSGALVMH